MIGTTLAHFELLEKIGEGGMGEVFRARDQQLDRDVAIKVLPQAFSRDPLRVRRFEREAKVLASLAHPNIASIFGFHEDDGVRFLVMELIAGATLEPSIIEGGLALDRLLEIGIPFAEAIAFAHEKGIVHRDLKPTNVMQDASGRIRVLDFGVASLRQTEAASDEDETIDALTREGDIVGTVAYMAPEQLEGHTADPRTDAFSIGVVLYELATGGRPFRGDSPAGVLSAILRDEPVPLTVVRPDLPPDLARVVRRCLVKNPERRIQTVTDIRNELEEIRSGLRTTSPGGPSPNTAKSWPAVERSMVITTEHVRQLSTRIPRMVGDSMTYLDNERESDVLVVYLHGLGGDQGHFADVVRQTPFRAVAPSLFGFGQNAGSRPPLPFLDHNLLVKLLINEVSRRAGSRVQVLVGHSSGADQMLHLVGADDDEGLPADGLILLGPGVMPRAGFVSGPYSRLTDDPAGILETIQAVAAAAGDLETWLTLHSYLVGAFGKFGTDIAAVRELSKSLIAEYERDRFFELFQAATERVKHIRCIFSSEEQDDADHVLERHISCNALGDGFSEEMVVVESTGHLQLNDAAVLLPYVEEVVRLAADRRPIR